eukprot:jgi/Galph1/2694/GphlegSOOS_G1337.1
MSFAEQYEELLGNKPSTNWKVSRNSKAYGEENWTTDRILEQNVKCERVGENTRPMQTEALAVAKDGTESARRARKMAEEARLIGTTTAEELGNQTKQLEGIQDDVEGIHYNLGDAEHIIHEIEGGFWGDVLPFRKPSKLYSRAGAPVASREPEQANKGVFGVDLGGMKNGKTNKNTPWSVVKNQEERKRRDSDERTKTVSSKNPFKYIWQWWSREDNGKNENNSSNLSKNTSCSVQSQDNKNSVKDLNRLNLLLGNGNIDKHLRKQDEELDRISSALKDMKDIALRMNEEMRYQEQIIDNLTVNVEDAGFRLRGDLRRVKRI